MSKKQLPLFTVHMNESAGAEVNKVLYSGFIGEGEVNKELERELGRYFNTEDLISTNSATSAEHLAYELIKDTYRVEDGDEVLCTGLSCFATISPIIKNRLKLKWVDVDPETLNIDLQDLKRKITPRTKVIQLVHWGGYPNNLDEISCLIEDTYYKFGFCPTVVEDCAHALGSKYKGKLIGTGSNIYTFSFQAIKHITGGDLGALVAPTRPDFIKDARLRRWYGIDREIKNKTDARCTVPIDRGVGHKFHANDIVSAILLANWKDREMVLNKHRENAAYYDENLRGVPGVTLLKRHEWADSSFWIYSMLVERREDFARTMKEKGIHTSIVHDRLDLHPVCREFKAFLPALDKVMPRLTHIPVHSKISAEDREYIVDAIKSGW